MTLTVEEAARKLVKDADAPPDAAIGIMRECDWIVHRDNIVALDTALAADRKQTAKTKKEIKTIAQRVICDAFEYHDWHPVDERTRRFFVDVEEGIAAALCAEGVAPLGMSGDFNILLERMCWHWTEKTKITEEIQDVLAHVARALTNRLITDASSRVSRDSVLEEVRQFLIERSDAYSTDLFPEDSRSPDADAARVMRRMLPLLAEEIEGMKGDER